MLEMLKRELTADGVFSGTLPTILEDVTKSISAQYLPARMKMTIAIAEIMLYAGQYRRHIMLWNKALIPINMISFSIAKSGAGKDRAVSEARKCFDVGYNKLEGRRLAIAKQKAIELAAADGVEDPNSFEVYKKYYSPPPPLFTAVTNSAAFLSHVAELEKSGVGAGYIYAGEFGSELQTNPDMITTIKDISELYDQGGKESKPLKDKGNQTAAIDCMSVSALFVGSPDNILFDENIKRKLKLEFSTKLARRAIFNFSPEDIPRKQYTSSKDIARDNIKYEDAALAVRERLIAEISDLTDYQTKRIGEPIKVDNDVRELFETYLEYNAALAEVTPKLFPISKLVRTHLQWKALKIAGAIAFFNKHESITRDDYISAISFVELLDSDMANFEAELTKEPYELFVDYMRHISKDGESSVSLHLLRKLGYIPLTGKPEIKIKELVSLASSYDKTGIYTGCNEGICFKQLVKSNTSGVSYVAVSGTKDERARQCATGFKFAELGFSALSEMLVKDWAYSPFQFKDGIRGKDNIIGGCKWICLDVDKSSITDLECHLILSGFNHHIVRTSNADNEFKFRILLELDAYVDVPDKVWKQFIKSIADYLSIDCDLLPKAQIFFSYAGRTIYSTTDAKPIEVKDHLMLAYEYADNRPDVSLLTRKQQDAQLDDKRNTFDYAYDASPGNRSLMLIRAAKHARTLNLDKQGILDLVTEINNYWTQPLDANRFQTTILNQISRW